MPRPRRRYPTARERIDRALDEYFHEEAGGPPRRRLLLVAVRAGASRPSICRQLGISRQALSEALARAREDEGTAKTGGPDPAAGPAGADGKPVLP